MPLMILGSVPLIPVQVCRSMLAANRPADVAPEVNLRNPLHSGDEAHEQRIYTGFETQNRGMNGLTKRANVFPKFMKNALKCHNDNMLQLLILQMVIIHSIRFFVIFMHTSY